MFQVGYIAARYVTNNFKFLSLWNASIFLLLGLHCTAFIKKNKISDKLNYGRKFSINVALEVYGLDLYTHTVFISKTKCNDCFWVIYYNSTRLGVDFAVILLGDTLAIHIQGGDLGVKTPLSIKILFNLLQFFNKRIFQNTTVKKFLGILCFRMSLRNQPWIWIQCKTESSQGYD